MDIVKNHMVGRWEFHDDDGTWQITDSDNKPICLVRHGITDEARQLANAYLIVRAPELLSIVGRFVDTLPRGCMHVPTYLIEASQDLLRAIDAGEATP